MNISEILEKYLPEHITLRNIDRSDNLRGNYCPHCGQFWVD